MTVDNKKLWGATLQEWDTLEQLGLTPDLLPVVSNLDAEISKQSKMVGLGKTPSHYNGMGFAAGIPRWTEKTTTSEQVTKWREESDYGICIQTRNVRALDIDVPDEALAKRILDLIAVELDFLSLPMRYRKNSGKCLLAFRLEGTHAKRAVKVKPAVRDENGKVIEPAWQVEFLGNGQQFIAAGTHTSGARYEWAWHDCDDFPNIIETEFNAVWQAIVDTFGVEDEARGGVNRKTGSNLALRDENVDTLEELGLVLGYGKEGQLHINCPWKHEHSSDTGIAQTSYFPAGTRGYEQGHFHCFHASCAKRTDGDYLNALGITAAQFDEVEPVEDPNTGEEEIPLPPLMRNGKGDILSTVFNVKAILKRPDVTGVRLRFDTFRDEIMWAHYQENEWLTFGDEHNVMIRERLDTIGFKPVGKEVVRDVVYAVAIEHKFDSAIEWLNRLPWDGVPRVATFASQYLGTPDNPYTQAVSKYLWSALAGRILEPAVKADMVPILVGAQGARKSTAVAAIAPDPQFFTEISFHENEADLARRMRGRVVGEIAELQGLRTREIESIKAFVTRQYEDWVPKYKEFATNYARRIVFVGTSNDDQFLSDETGHRRWLPMKVDMCDPTAIERDRLQLWAEAREVFNCEGIDYLTAELLAQDEHETFREVDDWESVILDWLTSADGLDDTTPAERKYLRNADILREALGINADRMKRLEAVRLAKIMPRLGYDRSVIKENGRSVRGWVRK